jgi:hypothetical protein
MMTLLLWFSHGEKKDLEIWITKDHRVKESWIKKYVVDPLDMFPRLLQLAETEGFETVTNNLYK